ncbi:MAG: HDOD domain-containing protein [Desulfonatronovibrionaceae bacterium]
MGMLDIKELSPGMVVDSDVTTPGGRLILSAGTELQERHILFLQRWGVSRVNIRGEIDPNVIAYENISSRTLAELEGYLNPCFACNDINDPVIRRVYDIGLANLARKAASGWKISKTDPFVPVNDGSFADMFVKGGGGPTDIVRHEVELVSFPDIYFRIREAIDQKDASADKIAEVVSKDTSLSAKLLRLVNSPFYGLRERIGSISRAVTLIGAQELSSLALGISAVNAFKDIPEELVDMRSFWMHSLAVGILAKKIAQRLNTKALEKFFVAGMLHDMGRLVIFKKLPVASTEAIRYSYYNLLPLVEAERDVIGFEHSTVGAMLVRAWRLPRYLEELLYMHHSNKSFTSRAAAIIHLADFLVIGMQFVEKGSLVLPILNTHAWELSGLALDDLDILAQEVREELEDTFRALEI